MRYTAFRGKLSVAGFPELTMSTSMAAIEPVFINFVAHISRCSMKQLPGNDTGAHSILDLLLLFLKLPVESGILDALQL